MAQLIREGVIASDLTPQQQRCMALLAAGLSRQEVADELGVAYQTVKRHLSMAYQCLGASNAVQAVNVFLDRYP